ncbi:MAG: hypothetical protein QXQ50_07790 [Candidatus Bathyarchaeia archaeon]
MSNEGLVEAWEIRPGWSYFLWKNLGRIADLMFSGEYVDALRCTLILCRFLPKDVKEMIKPDMVKAMEALKVNVLDADDPFTVLWQPEKERHSKAQAIIGDFIERIVEILDVKGYLEKPTRPYTLPELEALLTEE